VDLSNAQLIEKVKNEAKKYLKEIEKNPRLKSKIDELTISWNN